MSPKTFVGVTNVKKKKVAEIYVYTVTVSSEHKSGNMWNKALGFEVNIVPICSHYRAYILVITISLVKNRCATH